MSKSQRKRSPHEIEWLVSKLNGSVEIGAESLVQDFVRELLEHPALCATALWEAVTAIGTGSRPRKWRKGIDAAFKRLPRTEKRLARRAMLAYHHMIGDSQAALAFCSLRELNRGCDVMFAMDVLLDRGKLDTARALGRRAMRMLQEDLDKFERDQIIDAVASFLLRTRHWDEALELLAAASRNGPLARNAAVGTAEVHLARALDTVGRELETVTELKHAAPQDRERMLSLPGNEEELLRETEKDLVRLKRGLERLVRAERRRSLGLK